MQTAVIGDGPDGHKVYDRQLPDLAQHDGFTPREYAAYRAKTKVERPFRDCRHCRDTVFARAGDLVARRELDVYDQVAGLLAQGERGATGR